MQTLILTDYNCGKFTLPPHTKLFNMVNTPSAACVWVTNVPHKSPDAANYAARILCSKLDDTTVILAKSG